MIKERENWIDWAKAIGILLVVMGHSVYQPAINDVIFVFHMPLFFFISGYLTSPKSVSYRELAVKSWHQLLIPYVLFNLIMSVRFLVPLFFDWRAGNDLLLAPRVFGPLRALVLGLPDGQFCGPGWFLLALIWCRFLHKFIQSQRLYYALLSIVALGGLFTLRINLYCFSSAIVGLIWFELGYFVKQNKHRLTLPTVMWWLMAIAGFIAVYVVYKINAQMGKVPGMLFGSWDYRTCQIGGLFGVIGSVIGIAAVCAVSKLLQGVRWGFILLASQATLVIMCLHMLLQQVRGLIPILYDEGLYTFVGDLTIMVFLALCYPLISRYMPALTGGRGYQRQAK